MALRLDDLAEAPSCRRSFVERSPRRLPWIRTNVAVDVACRWRTLERTFWAINVTVWLRSTLWNQSKSSLGAQAIRPSRIGEGGHFRRDPWTAPGPRVRGESAREQKTSAKRRKLLSNKTPGQRVFPGVSAGQRNPLSPPGGQEVAGSNPASPTERNPVAVTATGFSSSRVLCPIPPGFNVARIAWRRHTAWVRSAVSSRCRFANIRNTAASSSRFTSARLSRHNAATATERASFSSFLFDVRDDNTRTVTRVRAAHRRLPHRRR